MRQALPKTTELEIIIGVDGCPNTLYIAEKLLSKGIKIAYSDDNNGTYVMFNSIMSFASGNWICRFDADDVMRPGYISKQCEQLVQGSQMTMTWSIYTDTQLTTDLDHFSP